MNPFTFRSSRTARKNKPNATRASARHSVRFCESLEGRILLAGTPPTAVAGDKLVLFESAGTVVDIPPGGGYVVFATSGTNASFQSITDPTNTASGVFSYTPNTGADATVGFNEADGVHSLDLTFATNSSGTYADTNNNGSANGTFNLLPSPIPTFAPTTINGGSLTFQITGSGGSFAKTGSYSILPANSGNTYVVQNIKGATAADSGTATYSRTDPADATFSYMDKSNLSGTVFLSFASPTTGFFYNTDAKGPDTFFDFQVGTFTFASGPFVASSKTTLISQNNPVAAGASVTFVATVGSTGSSNTATGNVTFLDGSVTLGTVALNSSGQASFSTSSLTTGTHSITASYAGDANFSHSTSPVLTESIVHSHANNVAYVTQLYTDILDRPVDSAGLTYWVGKLDAGKATFTDLANSLDTSAEYDGDVVNGYFLKDLDRPADSAGLTYWVGKMQGGMTAEAVNASLLGSDEYFADAGSTNTGFITALYENLLSRTPDPSGLTYWTGKLATETRTQVAASMSDSDEDHTVIITGFYETFLHRAPDATGLAYWNAQLAAGVPQPQIITAFVTLPEYLTLHNIT